MSVTNYTVGRIEPVVILTGLNGTNVATDWFLMRAQLLLIDFNGGTTDWF